jgi:hypothetical protein
LAGKVTERRDHLADLGIEDGILLKRQEFDMGI